MLVSKFNNYKDIPGSEFFSEKIPVFATQNYADYLKELKDHETIWFANLENNIVSHLIPLSVSKKLIFRKGYFLTGVISFHQDNSPKKEKEFLESVINCIKKDNLCDWIQQGPNWALFNTFPSGSKAVKFGTYRINLKDKNEDELFRSIYNADRRSIKKAKNNNVEIRTGVDCLSDCLDTISATAKTAMLDSLSESNAKRLLYFLGKCIKIYVSYKQNIPQCSAIFIGNNFCTYAHYAGSVINAFRGSNVLLNWEAIKNAKTEGCEYFDFVGARINPPPGSKLERIQRFKEHFGGEFVQGYIWKMVITKWKFNLYQILFKFYFLISNKKIKKDIIDQELEVQKNEDINTDN